MALFEDEKEIREEEDMMNEKPDYQSEIIQIIRSNASPRKMIDELSDYHENDLAEVLPQLEASERKKLYRILDVDVLSDIFEYVEEDELVEYLSEMNIRKTISILGHMESDSAAEVLRQFSKEKREIIVDLLDESARKDIALIASFDEEEIGSKMSTNYIEITDNLTIKQAMASLIEQAAKNDNISTLFVVDAYDQFYGAIDLKELIIARKDANLQDLIVTSYPYVYGNEEIDDCIEKLKDYSEDSIPVLSNDNRLLGVITSQSIIEVVDDEMGEDYARLAGLMAEEDLQEPLKTSLSKRLPWLFTLLFLGMIVSSVVGYFEEVVVALPLVITFQSLILDMAGNVGTQSLAVTIRVLMDESLTFRQKFGLVVKEIKTGASLGIIIGVLSFVVVGIFIYLLKGRSLVFSFAVSGCIALALFVSMIVSSAMGTLIPLFFKKIGIDPAVASGPLITTINDLVAVVCYYGLAWILLLQVFQLA